MYKRIFLDANVAVDIFDASRPFHYESKASFEHLIRTDVALLTSCDLVTTVYYLEAKKDRSSALDKIEKLAKFVNILEFSNPELATACQLMRTDPDYTDLEDTIQYVLAQKAGCDLILTNDKNFTSKNIPLLSTPQFARNKESKA